MKIEQKYTVDREHRRAFHDICTVLIRYLLLPICTAICLYMSYSSKSAFISPICFIFALVQCVLAIIDRIHVAKAGSEKCVWHYEYNERAVTQHGKDGKRIAVPYRSITNMYENDGFLKIATNSFAAVLKKDELSPETLNEVKTAIGAECPGAKQRTVHRGRSLVCTIITAITTMAVLTYSVVCLLTILDGFAYAPRASDAAVAHYTEAHSISRVGCWASGAYISSDGRNQLLYVGNYDHKMCPTDVYYVSYYDREWHAREVTGADIPLEFRTDTALVRVIQIDECCLLEVRCADSMSCRTEALYPQRAWGTEECNNGEFDKIRTLLCPEGIRADSILYLDDEVYPIGEMLSAGTDMGRFVRK